ILVSSAVNCPRPVTVISTFALRNAAAYSSGSERVTTALEGICIFSRAFRRMDLNGDQRRRCFRMATASSSIPGHDADDDRATGGGVMGEVTPPTTHLCSCCILLILALLSRSLCTRLLQFRRLPVVCALRYAPAQHRRSCGCQIYLHGSV